MKNETVIVLDFGGQYNQLIARRVRECHVYCEVLPYTAPMDQIKEKNPVGIIFTGGPNSVYAENAPKCNPAVFELGIPVLGICYGSQLMAQQLGGSVARAEKYHLLDEPYRLCGTRSGGLPDYRINRQLSCCSLRKPGKAVLQRAVPPRGEPHTARN